MVFSEQKPIYLQIASMISDRILSGELGPDDRIPSVREYAAEVGVNPNTLMRSYEHLSGEQIIYNKRGIGFFVAADARERILEIERAKFLDKEWPHILERMHLLGITMEQLADRSASSSAGSAEDG